MVALLYAIAAVGFYAWIVRSAKEVPSPLGVWVSEVEETSISKVA